MTSRSPWSGASRIVDIRASLTRILSGDDVRISWTAENVRNVEVDGVAVTGTSGFEDENPTRTERYEITAEDLLGRPVSDDVTVTVVGDQPDRGHPGEPDPDPVGRRRPGSAGTAGERPERGGRRGGGDGHQRLRGREPDADRALRDHGGGPAGPGGVGRRHGHRGRGPAGSWTSGRA